MQGFTPWEIAALKVSYHGLDLHHKGYLDFGDFDRLCAASHLNLTPQEAGVLFNMADVDGNGKLSFEEFLAVLQTANTALVTPSVGIAAVVDGEATVPLQDPQEVFRILRVGLTDSDMDMAAMCAGGIMGVLPFLKGKLVVFLGTMFSDPMRLFRDTFVDYHSSLSAAAAKGSPSAAQPVEMGLLEAFRGVAKVNLLRAVMWLLYAASLDAMAGVTMFLTYGKVRRMLVRDDWTAQSLADHPYVLEGISGFVGGAAGGVVERPLRCMANHHVLNPLRLVTSPLRNVAFHGLCWSVTRHSITYACFFTGFKYFFDTFRYGLYRRCEFPQTSWSDAMVTTGAGCAAGGAYRLVSHPMMRVYLDGRSKLLVSQGAPLPTSMCSRVTARGAFRAFAATHRFQPISMMQAACAGLGQSLAWSMPVTGVAFLAYERMLVKF